MANGKTGTQDLYAPKVSEGEARFRPVTLGSNGNTGVPLGCTDSEAPQLPTHRSRVRHSFQETGGKPSITSFPASVMAQMALPSLPAS